MSWSRTLGAAPLSVAQNCTRIEIKPHTRQGVSDGVGQLLGAKWAAIRNPACPPGQNPALYLITYDLYPAPSTSAMIRMLRVDPSTRAAIGKRGWTLASLGFTDLGLVRDARLGQSILRRDCPNQLGSIMETRIRDRYGLEMRLRFPTWQKLPQKSVSATGPDIDHELAEFLAELADELSSP